jgi:hypothetical protein
MATRTEWRVRFYAVSNGETIATVPQYPSSHRDRFEQFAEYAEDAARWESTRHAGLEIAWQVETREVSDWQPATEQTRLPLETR